MSRTGAELPSLGQLGLFDPGWCQRWTNGKSLWLPTGDERFNPKRHTVRAIPEQVARAFISTHHYSHSYPAARLRYGLFEGCHLVGVAVIGQPMHRQVTGKPFPTLGKTAAELSRFVLLDPVPPPAESWLLGRVFRLAAADGLRGLVAFSDPMPRLAINGQLIMPGHVGTIYQATNGRYTGRATRRTLVVLPDGTVFSERSLQKIRGCERADGEPMSRLVTYGAEPFSPYLPPVGWLPGEWNRLDRWADLDLRGRRKVWLKHALTSIGARRARHRGNHRFVWPLGDRSQRRRTVIALDAQPYPKTTDPWDLAA
ncbi:hypothetical protein BDK92_7177 [Micromonospora pisi]|uniref:Uncharacterized protein n=1 Tax=Micromonospora pisi TaxID=589240 RepID=A0A495JWZ7_9ACTN|nr:hypothetical protein [Micromonospora pisi]RKR92699.1 hypothetical protein BDK92_7177 [Micromonospora pisi]